MNRKLHVILSALLALPLLLNACRDGESGTAGDSTQLPLVLTTAPPIALIVSEIAQGVARVESLVPVGASPELYELLPSDLRRSNEALALFYVSGEIDLWAERIPHQNRIRLLDAVAAERLLPFPKELSIEEAANHSHHHSNSETDPHIWTDPLLVAELLPTIASELCQVIEDNCPTINANRDRFLAELLALNEELTTLLQPLRGRSVVLFHPSLQYFLHRYGITLAAAIEPFPGREPTPRSIQKILRIIEREKIPAIFTEPQLPERSAMIVAEAAGLPLYRLDPLGGAPPLDSYTALLRYNATTLFEAFHDGTESR